MKLFIKRIRRPYFMFSTEKALTYEYYLECGKYDITSKMSDARLSEYVSLSFEEIRNFYLSKSRYYAISYSKVFRDHVEATEENLLKYLRISEDHQTDFDMIAIKYWLRTYDLDWVLKDVFKDGFPNIAFITLAITLPLSQFRNYSTLTYRWKEINSEALQRFLEMKEEYNPFTDASQVVYFFKRMSEILVEVFERYKIRDRDEVWSEVHRLSWDPTLVAPEVEEQPPELSMDEPRTELCIL